MMDILFGSEITDTSKTQVDRIPYQVIHACPGRIRIYVPQLAHDPEYAKKLERLLKFSTWITDTRINRAARSLTVYYNHSGVSSVKLQQYIATAIQQATAPQVSAHSTSALAKRLGVSSQYLGRHKSQLDFYEWSLARDPQGIAWFYEPKSKCFYPVEYQDKSTLSAAKVWDKMLSVGKATTGKLGGMAGRVTGEVLGVMLLGSAGLVLGAELGAIVGEEVGALLGEAVEADLGGAL